MITDTPTPTETATPTLTLTPTLNYYIEVTTPAGEAARIERTVTAGDWMIIMLLVFVLASMWGMFFLDKLGGEK